MRGQRMWGGPESAVQRTQSSLRRLRKLVCAALHRVRNTRDGAEPHGLDVIQLTCGSAGRKSRDRGRPSRRRRVR
jgi:hypothetical protein